ncbi:LysM peptidoglycan-binding domain-containing protein [Cryobacterium melibiosiphilum]|uniref:LysM peptidoglycan-binding domain-containing protein n=1 Tax=Cryobacterium melibiosiphilum TaxID=995039 RepID=UPI001F186783|nr:LysM peptidoglycan-binding domain-containing protein [Cryobacterium melibiosiphilum]
MSTIVQKVVALAQKRRDSRPNDETPSSRGASRSLALSVPIVLVSTLAISLNLASPAQAAVIAKKPLGSGPLLAAPAPTLATAAVRAEAAPVDYTVAEGDTISGIAARFGLASASVLALNGLGWSALIFPGQVLKLAEQAPAPAATPAAAPAAGQHTVASGDTISGIAAGSGQSIQAILDANGLTRSSTIFPGQSLVIPGAAATVAAVTPVAAPVAITPVAFVAPPAGSHTIAAGDTIGAVAAAAGLSVQEMLDANGLGWSSIIYPGQVLTVPQPAAVIAAAAAAAAAEAAAAAAQAETAVAVTTVMTDEMRQNAQTIVSVGRAAGVSDQGLVIALAAAAQESGLRNVDHGDRDSLGLFQQRPSIGWGTDEQVMDPTRASLAFFGGAGNPNPGVTRGLLDIPGWESMSVTDAAQAVQISAHPDFYAKWEASARLWLPQLG